MDNPAQENTERLMRYLDGEMTPEEKKEFEKTINRDKEMKETLQGLEIARDAVRLYGLKKKVAEVHQLMMEEMKPGKSPSRTMNQLTKLARYGITLAAAILLVFLLIESYNFYILTSEGLYQEKYSDFIIPAALGDTSGNARIEKSFSNTKYQEIIAYNRKDPFFKIRHLFFLGMAYMKTENLSKAIMAFNSILDKNKISRSDTLQDETEYYLALTYLKNKDYDQAIVLMKKIHEDPVHLYNRKFTATFIRRVKMLKWR